MTYARPMPSRSRCLWALAIVFVFVVVIAWLEHEPAWSYLGQYVKLPGTGNNDDVKHVRPSKFDDPAPRLPHDPILASRLQRSEHLWKQSVEDRKEMLSTYTRWKPRFPDGYIFPYNVWDFVRPTFSCPHDLERVGTLGDGGKWVCGMSRYEDFGRQSSSASDSSSSSENGAESRPLIIYSFGVNDDSSFEAAFLERTNAEIWGYDFSVSGWAKQITPDMRSRAHFSRAGIARESDPNKSPPFFSVQDLMRINNHTYIDVIKMDIEGAEYDAMSSLVSFVESSRQSGQPDQPGQPFGLPIGQLLIELHIMKVPKPLSMPKDMEAWLQWWETLEEMGMRPVNNEDNWIGDNAYGKPRFMEYTLINVKDQYRNVLLQ